MKIDTADHSRFYTAVLAIADLVKIKLTLFVVFSAVIGYFIGASQVHFVEVFWLAVGGFFITCSANAFNQAIEKDYDKLMKRTATRPVASGVLRAVEVYWLASVVGFLGVLALWYFLNPLSGILGVLAIFLYAAVYTPMKRISSWAVFVGAFPGAIPPMLGYVAASGLFSMEAGVLFFIQFVWQFPHFWAIAWRLDDQYEVAGFKMMPFAAGRSKFSARIILGSVLVLMACSFLTPLVGMTGWLTAVVLLGVSSLMLFPAIKLLKTLDGKYALKTMLMSYVYLLVSLFIIFIDKA